MAKYREGLPQLADELFLTDGGLETTLMSRDGLELPHFAAFDLLKDASGNARLRDYFIECVTLAKRHGLGFVLETPTWRASDDWGAKLGYSPRELTEANWKAVELLREIREALETEEAPMVVSGCIGPRYGGHAPADATIPATAGAYHATQIRCLRDAGADMVSAFSIATTDEAIGITEAARGAEIPAAISFTVKPDGRLPGGQPLGEAIETVDQGTNEGPAYYMINCAHPTHIASMLSGKEPWLERIRGIRANASRECTWCKSPMGPVVCDGPNGEAAQDFADQYRELRQLLPNLRVLGGCCGTGLPHLEAICSSCV